MCKLSTGLCNLQGEALYAGKRSVAIWLPIPEISGVTRMQPLPHIGENDIEIVWSNLCGWSWFTWSRTIKMLTQYLVLEYKNLPTQKDSTCHQIVSQWRTSPISRTAFSSCVYPTFHLSSGIPCILLTGSANFHHYCLELYWWCWI